MRNNLADIIEFLQQEFPQSLDKCRVDEISRTAVKVSYRVDHDDLRPGNTVAGPTMVALADFAVYVAILANLGFMALAVTSSLNINFLRKPKGNADLWAECRLLKVGRTLVIGEVLVYSYGQDEAVAQVTASYVLPK